MVKPKADKDKLKKVAVGCQGGGMHAAFGVGVLTEILKDVGKNRFELVGLSGTSAGALCALMAWYGLAPKNGGREGSVRAAIDDLDRFWNGFVARTPSEVLLNLFTYGKFWAEEQEIPVLGVNAPVFGLNPFGAIMKAVAAGLPTLGVRRQYLDLDEVLAEACLAFNDINWSKLQTRLLIGASEVINGFETVFDSDVNKGVQAAKVDGWRQRLPLSLSAVAASGTLPTMREAEPIDGGYYWDGLYSQNPPVREFIAGSSQDQVPDELWIVRINPQRWPYLPRSNSDIQDRQNELMGNLSLHKELDFIMAVNKWRDPHYSSRYGEFTKDHKHVTVRTIKMRKGTTDNLQYSSKFDRDHDLMDQLRREGREVAREWLDAWWPSDKRTFPSYPDDASYPHETDERPLLDP